MSKISKLINKFNSGELSKLVHSRVDFNKREGGAAVLENFIPLIQGPITSRSGTVYCASSFNNRCGLIPFEYSVDQAYMIEVSANMFRYIKNHAIITRTVGTATAYAKSTNSAVSSITAATPSVVTLAAGHTISANDHFSFSGVGGTQAAYLNNKAFIAQTVDATHINTFKRNAQESTVTATYGFPATYTYTAASDFVIKGPRFTLAAHGLITGDVVLLSGITGGGDLATALNSAYYRVMKVDADNFDLFTLTSGGAVDTSAIADTTITGNVFTWVGTWHPYSQTDLFPTATPSIMALGYTQSTNTLFLANKAKVQMTLTRSDDDSWVYAPYRTYDGPYLNNNITTTTMVVTAGTDDLVASAVTGVNDGAGFTQDDVGRDIRVLITSTASAWAYGTIVAVKSTTTADIAIEAASGTIGYLSGVRTWRLGVWGGTNGYPSTVSFYQDRLCWSGRTAYPERVDMSMSGVYNRYNPTSPNPDIAVTDAMTYCFGLSQDATDECAISISLLSNEVNYIRWIAGTEKGLVIGTAGGEWLVSASQGAALTPTNASAVLIAPYGSAPIQPVRISSGLIHAQRSCKKARALSHAETVDGYSSTDITLSSEHILDSGVCSMTYQKEPWSVIWMVRDDGVLASCTYDESESALGWARHTIAPYVGPSSTAFVECVASIPDPAGDRNDVYMIVKRIYSGVTTRTIEYFGREFITDYESGIMDSVCLDASYTVSDTSSNTITASWLASKIATVVADGQEFDSLTGNGSGVFAVTGGLAYRNLCVGAPFTAKYEGLEILPTGDRAPQGVGKIKRLNQAVIKLYKSLYGRMGRHTDHVDLIPRFTTKIISGISISTVGIITTTTPHGFKTGDIVLIYGIVGTAGTDASGGLNGETYKVSYVSGTTFSLRTMAGVIVPTTGKAYTGGGSVLQVCNGYREMGFPGDFDRGAQVCIEQRDPFPMTVVSVTIDLDTKE